MKIIEFIIKVQNGESLFSCGADVSKKLVKMLTFGIYKKWIDIAKTIHFKGIFITKLTDGYFWGGNQRQKSP